VKALVRGLKDEARWKRSPDALEKTRGAGKTPQRCWDNTRRCSTRCVIQPGYAADEKTVSDDGLAERLRRWGRGATKNVHSLPFKQRKY